MTELKTRFYKTCYLTDFLAAAVPMLQLFTLVANLKINNCKKIDINIHTYVIREESTEVATGHFRKEQNVEMHCPSFEYIF